jgi:hypothetical protein
MSKTTKPKTTKTKPDVITLEEAFEHIAGQINDLRHNQLAFGQTARDVAESVDAWKIATIVLAIVTAINIVIIAFK